MFAHEPFALPDSNGINPTRGYYEVRFDPGSTTATLSLSARDDGVRESQDYLEVEIFPVGHAAGDPDTARVDIIDPTITVTIAAGQPSITEELGELAPDEFNLEGKAYTVLTLMRWTDQWFIFALDQALPGDFTLQVGGTTLNSDEASSVNTSSSQAEYQWQNQTPDLSEGDTVEVSLTVSSGD